MKKTGLGRGLDALLPETNDLENTVSMISITELDRNPDQPRREFDEEALQTLADSIRRMGATASWRANAASGRPESPGWTRYPASCGPSPRRSRWRPR